MILKLKLKLNIYNIENVYYFLPPSKTISNYITGWQYCTSD